MQGALASGAVILVARVHLGALVHDEVQEEGGLNQEPTGADFCAGEGAGLQDAHEHAEVAAVHVPYLRQDHGHAGGVQLDGEGGGDLLVADSDVHELGVESAVEQLVEHVGAEEQLHVVPVGVHVVQEETFI